MHPEAITRVWAGGENSFFLDIDHLRAVEKQCGIGCSVLTLRLLAQQGGVDDIIAPIRIGLIGGGMKESEARDLISKALTTHKPQRLAPLAADIMAAFWIGAEADDPGESLAGAGMAQTRQDNHSQVG